jgi:hypothetical protein
VCVYVCVHIRTRILQLVLISVCVCLGDVQSEGMVKLRPYARVDQAYIHSFLKIPPSSIFDYTPTLISLP